MKDDWTTSSLEEPGIPGVVADAVPSDETSRNGDSKQGEGTRQQPPKPAEANLRTLLLLRRFSTKVRANRSNAETAPKGWAETEEAQQEEEEARQRYERSKTRFRQLLELAGEQFTEFEQVVKKAGPKVRVTSHCCTFHE